MENFTAYNPTLLHFGKNVCQKLPEILNQYGKRILLIYGKGSVIKNGIYDKVKEILKETDFEISEYSGIKPNPIIEDVEKAVSIGIKEKSDMILAIGGGSVIDSAKFVSLCIPGPFKPWDLVSGIRKPVSSIPVITVLTLAATGTEMNQFAVIQNHNTNEKVGYGSPLMYPKHSFLDPQFTFSVPKDQTAFGISDIIAHAFENYFGIGESRIADKFATQIISECLHFGPLVLNEPQNYDYRANIMMLSTCALNGITVYGKTRGDWGVHSIGHTLSMLFDTPHGASLSIAYPAWFRLMKTRIPEKIQTLSNDLFNNNNIDDFIESMRSFYMSIGSPVKLPDVGIKISDSDNIMDLMKKNKVSGNVHKLSENDYRFLLNEMFGN